jgi:hypothetical protein
MLPEFSRSCRIDNQHAFVFAGQCNYDIIFGLDFLCKIGMKHIFDLGSMTAFDITIKINFGGYTNELADESIGGKTVMDVDRNQSPYCI